MPKLSRQERGYGRKHDLLRLRWAAKVRRGLASCARCHLPIDPLEPWDLGHLDDRTGYQGPEHAKCNRSAGGRNGAMVANALRTKGAHTSQVW